jgi:membrane protein required for colicin V production
MTIFDYVALSIIGLSVFLGLLRGFVHEALAIIGWIVAFYVANSYVDILAPMMPVDIPTESLRLLASFVILFLATLLTTSLIAIVLATLLKKIGLGWFNRWLGMFFGFARGLVVVCILVMLAGLTEIPKDDRWRNAMFSATFEAVVQSSLIWLPESIASYIHYD